MQVTRPLPKASLSRLVSSPITVSLGCGVLRIFKGPFAVLEAFLLWTVLCTVFLPSAVFIGYPWPLALGVWYAARWLGGHLRQRATDKEAVKPNPVDDRAA